MYHKWQSMAVDSNFNETMERIFWMTELLVESIAFLPVEQ